MRLKSAIWVAAFRRTCEVRGLYCAVIRKGAEEAGAVYVIVNHLDGTLHLFGPAPGPAYDEQGERRWIEELGGAIGQDEIDSLLAKRLKSDPDL